MTYPLDGKVSVITGGGSGMGRATSELFAESGADVVVVDVDEDAASETVESIEKGDAPGTATSIVADVSDSQDTERYISRTVEEFGSIDVLYNNAGMPQSSTPIQDASEEAWDKIMAVNVKSAFLSAKYSVPYMLEQDNAVILNTASISGHRPRSGIAAYATSKGGMITLTKQLAWELAEDHIRVNAICPVATDTDMLPKFVGESLDMDDLTESIPMGFLAQPEDIAHTAAFLASDNARLVTGQVVNVGGGRSL